VKPTHRLVEIWWDDAFRQEGQPQISELEDDQYTCTVGYLVRENERSIVVAAEVLDGGAGPETLRGPTRIPKGMICEMRELRRVQPRRRRIGDR
jgi:hypothetical protein